MTKPNQLPKTKAGEKKCKHVWKEDEMFACGAVMMICGPPDDLGEETRVVCQKCGEVEYVRMKDLGSLMDIYKAGENDD